MKSRKPGVFPVQVLCISPVVDLSTGLTAPIRLSLLADSTSLLSTSLSFGCKDIEGKPDADVVAPGVAVILIVFNQYKPPARI